MRPLAIFFFLGEEFPCKFKLSIQISGVHFDYDELSRKKANFEATLKSIKRTLSMLIGMNTNCQIICRFKIYV